MRSRFSWQLRTRSLDLGARTLVMGIVNVTPDSFSDGGAHAALEPAVQHALKLLDEGADLIDIGGESTRPGAPAATLDAIAAEEEQARVLPVVRELLQRRPGVVISVDTYRASTARLAVEAGAEIVNDVSGLQWDRAMSGTLSELRCGAVLMQARGLPSEWRHLPPLAPEQIVPTVRAGLEEALERADAAGMERQRLVLDPGFGFGKRGAENWSLLHGLSELAQLGFPLLAGLSRKGFLSPTEPPHLRDTETHTANAIALWNGAHIVRVHDVAGARRAADVVDAVLAAHH